MLAELKFLMLASQSILTMLQECFLVDQDLGTVCVYMWAEAGAANVAHTLLASRSQQRCVWETQCALGSGHHRKDQGVRSWLVCRVVGTVWRSNLGAYGWMWGGAWGWEQSSKEQKRKGEEWPCFCQPRGLPAARVLILLTLYMVSGAG